MALTKRASHTAVLLLAAEAAGLQKSRAVNEITWAQKNLPYLGILTSTFSLMIFLSQTKSESASFLTGQLEDGMKKEETQSASIDTSAKFVYAILSVTL